MTTSNHTAIATGAAANASTFNDPLGELDAAMGNVSTLTLDGASIVSAIGTTALTTTAQTLTGGINELETNTNTVTAEVTAARDAYASLDARLDALVVAGGNVATLTNGAASAGQKVVTVDSTTGFVAGAYVAYALVGGALEYNTIGSITPTTTLTLGTNIGTGGIANDTYISMVSPAEYLELHGLYGVYNIAAYGAVGDGVTDDTAAFEAVLTAVKARSVSKTKSAIIELNAGANYLITGSLDFTDIADVVLDGKTVETKITYADADATAANRVLFDCLGSARLTFRNFYVYGDTTNIPAVIFSLGRSTDTNGSDSGHNIIERVYVGGYWTIAAIYNVESELMIVRDSWILNAGPDTATTRYGIYCNGYNDGSVGSEYATRQTEVPTMGCPWISRVNIGGTNLTSALYIPMSFRRGASSITVRDSYCYTYDDQPAIKFVGNIEGAVIENLLIEGTVDKSIHFAAHGGAGTINAVSIINCQLGTYTNVGIYSDAGTTINRLFIRNVTGNKGDNTSNITFAGAVNDSDIDSWWSQSTGVFTAANFYHSKLHVRNHTLTISDALGSSIWDNVNGGDHYHHLQTGLRVGTVGATNLAEINDIRTASATWDPAELDNGETEVKVVAVNGVTAADPWFALAHLTTVPNTGWHLSANVVDGAVYAVLTNNTGGTVDLGSGTLSVTAWKITPA